jgi:hypothetical protein
MTALIIIQVVFGLFLLCLLGSACSTIRRIEAVVRWSAEHATTEGILPVEAPPDQKTVGQLARELDHFMPHVRMRAIRALHFRLSPEVVCAIPGLERTAGDERATGRLRRSALAALEEIQSRTASGT